MITNNKKTYHAIVHFLLGILLMGFLNRCDRLNKPVGMEQDDLLKNITTDEAFALIQENEQNPNFLIVDVRTITEFNNGHIENAINIDYHSASFRDKVDQLDRNKVILIYCQSGGRSRSAFEIMKELGFKEVYNMLEGINGWTAAGYTIVE